MLYIQLLVTVSAAVVWIVICMDVYEKYANYAVSKQRH